jgi:type II secretory pathway component PulM
MSRTNALTARWAQLAPREKLLVGTAAAVVGVALLWWVGLAPALQTLRTRARAAPQPGRPIAAHADVAGSSPGAAGPAQARP